MLINEPKPIKKNNNMKTILDLSISINHTFESEELNTAAILTLQSLSPSMSISDDNEVKRTREVVTDFFTTDINGLREFSNHLLKVANLAEAEKQKLLSSISNITSNGK